VKRWNPAKLPSSEYQSGIEAAVEETIRDIWRCHLEFDLNDVTFALMPCQLSPGSNAIAIIEPSLE